VQSWEKWQQELVALLEKDLEGASKHLRIDEMDWTFWQTLFLEGRTPHSALNHVLQREL